MVGSTYYKLAILLSVGQREKTNGSLASSWDKDDGTSK